MKRKTLRELELKRTRGQVSCAECRRLKIKCDKKIPCQSCQRRGCAQLCPNGALATGQGTRFVLEATEHLHERIGHLGGRVRQLEDALSALQPSHPLLHSDHHHDSTAMLEDANGPHSQAEVIDAFGTLSIDDHGISRFFGPTGGSESLLLSHNNNNNTSVPSDPPSPTLNPLSLFSHSFPFTPVGSSPDITLLIRSHLPTWDHASSLCNTYFEQVSWIFRGVTSAQLIDDMLPVIYNRSLPPPGEDYSSPHDLALLFSVLSIGSLVQPEPSNSQAEHFQQLSRAALGLQPVLEKPSIVTIQSLHLMSIYNAMSGSDLKSDTSMEMTWSLITLASHLSQTIGLHRDSARWGLSQKMVQRRRILFWDLFVADVWQSLNTGRPPSFSLAYIDCSFPQYDNTKGGFGSAFEIWQFRFAAECVAEVTSRTLTAEAPSYATIMDLDRLVRQFPLPEALSNAPKNDLGASFQKCVLDHIKDTVLMYIHRSFFAQAIIDQPTNPIKSVYAPSFLASYRAASTILKSVREQFNLFPNSCSRFWTMWTFAFTAAVVFGTVVTRGPRSPLAQSAMAELDQALLLFTKASKYSIRALKSLPILNRLAERARYALENVKAGDGWNIQQFGVDDELAIYAGHTRFVSSNNVNKKSTTIPILEHPPPITSTSSYPSSSSVGWQPSYVHSQKQTRTTIQSQQQRSNSPSSSPSSNSYPWSNEPIVLHPPPHATQQPLTPPPYDDTNVTRDQRLPLSHPQPHPHHPSQQRPIRTQDGGPIELHDPYYYSSTSSSSVGDLRQQNRSHNQVTPSIPNQGASVPPPPPISSSGSGGGDYTYPNSSMYPHSHTHPPHQRHQEQQQHGQGQKEKMQRELLQNPTSMIRHTQSQDHHSRTNSQHQEYLQSQQHPHNPHQQLDPHNSQHSHQQYPHDPRSLPQRHPHSQHQQQHQSQGRLGSGQGQGQGQNTCTDELADLGLASRDSRLDERWSSFMADSGLLEGLGFKR